MLQTLISNQAESAVVDKSSSLSGKSRAIVRQLLQKAKGKSFGQLISLAFLKIVNYLTIWKYQVQYPNAKFGSGVTIRGKFSIKGKGEVEIGNNCHFISFNNQSNQIFISESAGRLTIGDNCFFNATTFKIEREGKIKIGEYCYFNGATVHAENFITFKKQCLVSDASLVDTDFHSIAINRWNPEVKAKTKPIHVEENVWIGSQSMILKGVIIGKNSVIGARSVVRKSVPDNVVVIGNPQQIVKELDTTVLPYELSQIMQ